RDVSINDCTPAATGSFFALGQLPDQVAQIDDGVADYDFRCYRVEQNAAVAKVEDAGWGARFVSAEKPDGEVKIGGHDRLPCERRGALKFLGGSRWISLRSSRPTRRRERARLSVISAFLSQRAGRIPVSLANFLVFS